jgi:hypothetical protein
MENKDVNEASANILQSSPVAVDTDPHEEKNEDQLISQENKHLDIADNLLEGPELKETTNQIFNQNQIDEGKNS